jgi:chromosome segregation ATPase
MSFLTQEQNEEVANLFKGDSVEPDNGDTNIKPEVKAASAVETQLETDVNTEDSSTPEQNEDSGHAVPYSRFKSVIEARNELRDRTSALESQLAELQNQLESRRAEPRQKEDDYFQIDEFEYDDADPYETRFQSYEDRIYQMEVANEQVKLNHEIQLAQQRFPDVGRDMLLQAVINDPDSDVMDVAERYSTFVNGLREQAIAEYLQTNPQAVAPPVVRPDAPPVVRVAGSSQAGKIPGSNREQSPRNLDEARNSLFDYLKANWSN